MRRNDRLKIGLSVPGAVLRALSVVVVVGGGMLLHIPFGWMAALGVAALFGAIVPQLGGNWVAAVILVGALLLEPPDPVRTAIVIAVVHLLHVLTSLALTVPLSARVALRALLRTGIRFVAVQMICQSIALTVAMMPRGPVVSIAVIAGAAAVLLLAFVATRMLRGLRMAAFSSHAAASRGGMR